VGRGVAATDAVRRRRHDALARCRLTFVDGERSYRVSRVLYPHQHWQTLDFVLGGIAVLSLAYGLLGLAMVASALNDVNSIQRECSFNECAQHGTVTKAAFTYFTTAYGRYCPITVDLNGGSHQVLIAGSVCNQIPVGSGVDATIWRGKIVIVKTAAGTFGTADNPGVGIGAGLFKMLAFVPFLLLVAMIHVDVANHRVVRRLRSRFQAS
jgi:hypothetical protein